MRLYLSLALGFSLATVAANAQTVFTFGNNPVSKEEFLREYQKTNAQKKADFSAASIHEYVNLYSLFKMKVKEAELMQLDTTAVAKSELNNYKNQLSRSYLSDKAANERLLKEAYERLKEEVKVAHILIAVRPNTDSAVANKKIDSIYNELTKNKADFAALAKSMSDDKGSATNGGEIGYITALQVVYPFENAAYNTPVGQVSKPFRTQFGYHIVKVEDKRKSKGQLQVAQIMIASPKSRGEEGLTAARNKMAEIQGKLKQGEKFEELASQFSEDKYSKDNGGQMEPFGVGKLAPEFEEAAFGLKNIGDISQPITTEYGVHLIKLIKKIPLQPLDSLKSNLERRIENDNRATIAKDEYQEKVKVQYGFSEQPENFQKLIAAFSDTAKTFTAEQFSNYKAPLFTLKGKSYSQHDFVTYAAEITRGNIIRDKNSTLGDLYKMYQKSILSDIQMAELEKTNAEYRTLVNGYRDGILIFEMMERNVWGKAGKDTVGLQNFYEQNKAKYQWQPGFEGVVYQSSSEVDLNKLKSRFDKGDDVNEVWKELNETDNPIQVSRQNGRFEFAKFPVDKSYFAENKTSNIFRNDDGSYSLVFVNQLYPAQTTKTLDEARGYAVADYQDYLEQKWNEELKTKYPVKMDDATLSKIIKK